MTRIRCLFVGLVALSACNAQAETDHTIGQRIITLSPHLAELVFTVGAGERLVGVSAFTDFPEAATKLPVIGDAFMVDLERLTLLEPDLLLAWQSGTPAHIVDELQSRGYRVEVIRTRNLADIPEALRRIGELTGQVTDANRAADRFLAGLGELGRGAPDNAPISVFYQVSRRPLYTVNGDHYVSELIEICGGINIFADLSKLAPLVGVEAVLDRDPEVMLASDDAGVDTFSEWDRWPGMAANRYGNRYLLPAGKVGRATPRLLDAGRAICDALEQGRRNREAVGD